MATSVKKSGTEYEVTINGKTIMLPEGSEYTEPRISKGDQYGYIGKRPEKYLRLDGRGYVIKLFEDNKFVKTIVDGDEDTYGAFVDAWDNRENPMTEGAGRRSRLNRKTRRSKRNGRHTKHRKLRKLTTRRR